jgi:hypothetical protein
LDADGIIHLCAIKIPRVKEEEKEGTAYSLSSVKERERLREGRADI